MNVSFDEDGRPTARADLIQHGVSDEKMASEHWIRCHHGVYRAVDSDEGARSRIAAAAEVMSVDGRITGWAALHLHGVHWMDGFGSGPSIFPVQVANPPHHNQRPRRGISFIQSEVPSEDQAMVGEIRTVTPMRACFDAVRRPAVRRRAYQTTEAVVALDAAVASGVIDLQRFEEYLDGHRRWVGMPLARKALDLCDGRVLSPWESRARVLWVEDACLPRPQINVAVFDKHGVILGYPDILDVQTGLVCEFDGAEHRALDRHTADNFREERFEDAGLTVVRVTSADLLEFRERTVRRLRFGHRRAGELVDRWSEWSWVAGSGPHRFAA